MTHQLSEQQQEQLVEMRGGCSCDINPPCFNCTDSPTVDELQELGVDEPDDDPWAGGMDMEDR